MITRPCRAIRPEDIHGQERKPLLSVDAFAKNCEMAKQKFCPTRLGGFSGVKAYIEYVKVLKNRRNAAGRTFCDAIIR